MRIIAITNQKGGVAKTTTAVNLGACIAKLRRKVLLVDLDPQGNLSSWLGIRINELEKSMTNVFNNDVPLKDIISETCVKQLWVAPSNVTLASVERTIINREDKDTILKDRLELIANCYDYVLFDCPPSLGLLTVNALTAAREVVIPLETKVMALNGLVTLINTVNLVKETLNPALEVTGIIACMFDMRTNLSNEVVGMIKEKFSDKLFKSLIRESTKLAECPISGQPITLYAPESRGTKDYMELAKEILALEKREGWWMSRWMRG
ncbi:MAG: ParA family protein [Candidatus Scalindua sp.]|nr:ParA family protein [Candidatus Scalindua sp.]